MNAGQKGHIALSIVALLALSALLYGLYSSVIYSVGYSLGSTRAPARFSYMEGNERMCVIKAPEIGGACTSCSEYEASHPGFRRDSIVFRSERPVC